MNHAAENAQNSPKRKIFEWTNVPEKIIWLYLVILDNWRRNGQKTPKKAWNRKKIAVFRSIVNKKPIEINRVTSNWNFITEKNEVKQ